MLKKGGIKEMKKLWLGIVIVILTLAIVFVLVQQVKKPKVIKIGAIFSQTGSIAPYGEKALEGFHLGIEEMKKDGLMVEVVLEDTQSNPQDAVSAFQKLATVHKVPVIIGPEASSLAMAIAPLANQYKIVLFAPTVSVDAYTTPNDYTFRNWPAARLIAEKMAYVAYEKLNLRKMAILHINNDMGVSYITSFKKKFEVLGGKVIVTESYSPDATDFRTQLTKIKAAHPEALYLIGHVEMGQVLKQMKELSLSLRILSGIGIEGPKTKEIAGDLMNGIIYTTPAYNPNLNDPIIANYERSFRKQYNKQSEIFAAATYDTVKILEKVLKGKSKTSDQIKNALFKIKDFHGVTGIISFDFNGDVIKDIAVKEVINGEFIFLDADLKPIRK